MLQQHNQIEQKQQEDNLITQRKLTDEIAKLRSTLLYSIAQKKFSLGIFSEAALAIRNDCY